MIFKAGQRVQYIGGFSRDLGGRKGVVIKDQDEDTNVEVRFDGLDIGRGVLPKNIRLEPDTGILGTQIGGNHYTKHAIQPIEYIWANNIGFSEGNVIKYVTRWKDKGGIKDLEKAKHHIELLIERENNRALQGNT